MIKYDLHSNHTKADSKSHGQKMFSSRVRGDLMVPFPCSQHSINWTSQSRWVVLWAIQQKGWLPIVSINISSSLQCLERTISHQVCLHLSQRQFPLFSILYSLFARWLSVVYQQVTSHCSHLLRRKIFVYYSFTFLHEVFKNCKSQRPYVTSGWQWLKGPNVILRKYTMQSH